MRYLKQLLSLLKKHYPRSGIVLNYANNWELLVAVMLSAQCTDTMVNTVTARLFPKYSKSRSFDEKQETAQFAHIPLRELEEDIKPTGFYRNKAKNIQLCARLILEKYSGTIPTTMKEMLTLPGVARKTANVVLGNAYGIVEGTAVDTHVKRVSHRLGLTKHTNPEKIERDLMKLFEKKEWFTLTYLLIDHGRVICKSQKPKCDVCFLSALCPCAFHFPHFKTTSSQC